MIRATLPVALALLLAPAASAAAAASGAGTTASVASVASVAAAAGTGEAEVDRTIRDRRIEESSGLAPSLLHPGVLWTHNDSGNSPRLYAIGTDGRTAATLGVDGEPDVDWEAIASLRAPEGSRLAGRGTAGEALLAIGDIGDNDATYPDIRVALVREPESLEDASVAPVGVLRLRYPGGARDAEALLADPRDGRLYVVSKAVFGAEIYAVPERIWPGAQGAARVSKVTTLTKVATVPEATLVTDGAFLPDGRMLLRGYGRMLVLAPPDQVRGGRLAVLGSSALPEQEQGESLAVTGDGREALIGSEGRRAPVLRVPVPAAAADDLPATGPATTATTGSRGADIGAGTRTAGDRPLIGDGGPGTWVLLLGGAVALLLLLAGAAALVTRMLR